MDISDPKSIQEVTENMMLNGKIINDEAAHRKFWADRIPRKTILEFTTRPNPDEGETEPQTFKGKFLQWDGFDTFIWIAENDGSSDGVNPSYVTNVTKIQ